VLGQSRLEEWIGALPRGLQLEVSNQWPATPLDGHVEANSLDCVIRRLPVFRHHPYGLGKVFAHAPKEICPRRLKLILWAGSGISPKLFFHSDQVRSEFADRVFEFLRRCHSAPSTECFPNVQGTTRVRPPCLI